MTNTSLWKATAAAPSFPSLQRDLTVDVAIVGGGITGMTLAWHLARGGVSVALLEAGRVGHGTTGDSTGNLYAVVGDGLASIAKKWGEERMRQVAASRAAAVDTIESIIGTTNIACSFRRVPWHLVVREAGTVTDRLEEELQVAQAAGLEARIDIPRLPFAQGRALIIERQAQFQPLAFVAGLATNVPPSLSIFEGSPVIEVDANDGQVRTASNVVRAEKIVLATHTPKGFNVVQTEIGPYREYVVAAEVDGGFPHGIYWTLESSRHSVRRFEHEGRSWVVVAGGKHKTGQAEDMAQHYATLERFVAESFGGAPVSHRWSAQGYYPADGLPYIGHAAASSRLFIATGYSADGLTYGVMAAGILASELRGERSPYAQLYQATRFDPVKSGRKFVKENANVAAEYVRDYAALLRAPEVDQLKPGEARVVELDGQRCAVHRGQGGELHAVSPYCTHLRCIVHWNNAETSWDCPCHGSRFRPDGSVIEGPALHPLARLDRGQTT